jgi:hypothetical protein
MNNLASVVKYSPWGCEYVKECGCGPCKGIFGPVLLSSALEEQVMRFASLPPNTLNWDFSHQTRMTPNIAEEV